MTGSDAIGRFHKSDDLSECTLCWRFAKLPASGLLAEVGQTGSVAAVTCNTESPVRGMSLFDLFRRFFEPGGRREPFFGGMTWEEEEDDDDEMEDSGYPFARPPAFDFGFSFTQHQDPFRDTFDGFFRDFNELFADFGSINVQIPEIQDIEPQPQKPEGYGAKTLRDFMLKYPDSQLPKDQPPHSTTPAFPKMPRLPGRIPWQDGDSVRIPRADSRQDRDLDSEVSSKGLDAILTPSRPRSSSYFKSVSVSRVTRPDGTTEERRTVTDSEGNTTTTVTVCQGDQILSSTTENPSRDALIDNKLDGTRDQLHGSFDMSDSQTFLRRILQKWFSQ